MMGIFMITMTGFQYERDRPGTKCWPVGCGQNTTGQVSKIVQGGGINLVSTQFLKIFCVELKSQFHTCAKAAHSWCCCYTTTSPSRTSLLKSPLTSSQIVKWDHTIEIVPRLRHLALKSTPCPQLNRSNWMDSSKRTWKADHSPPIAPWPLQSSSSKEGWKSPPSPRLLEAQRDDSEECLPTVSGFKPGSALLDTGRVSLHH